MSQNVDFTTSDISAIVIGNIVSTVEIMNVKQFGKICVFSLVFTVNSNATSNNEVIFSNLPKPAGITEFIGLQRRGGAATNNALRFRLNVSGDLSLYYTAAASILANGDSVTVSGAYFTV